MEQAVREAVRRALASQRRTQEEELDALSDVLQRLDYSAVVSSRNVAPASRTESIGTAVVVAVVVYQRLLRVANSFELNYERKSRYLGCCVVHTRKQEQTSPNESGVLLNNSARLFGCIGSYLLPDLSTA